MFFEMFHTFSRTLAAGTTQPVI